MFRMTRMRTIFSCSILFYFLVLLVAGVPQAHAATSPTTNWPTFGFNAQDTKFNPYEKKLNTANVSKLKLAWQQLDKGIGFTYTDSQEVVNGIVYVINGNGTVSAYDAQSGKIKWSTSVTTASLPVSVTVENGLVYVGGCDPSYSRGVLYALNATNGAIVWKSLLPADGATGIQSDLSYADGIVFGTWIDGYLRAFDAINGKQLWSQFTLSNYSSSAIANGLVYVGSAGTGSGDPTYLYAFHERTGTLAWKTEIQNHGRIASAPAVANGIVYVSDIDNNQLHAFNATNGNLLWSFPSPEGNAQDSPAIANGVVYITSPDNHLYALDAKTGKIRWSFAANGSIYASPTVANGIVYLSSRDSNIYALNANSGQKLWSYQISGGSDQLNQSAPTVVNGMLFISSYNSVFAFHIS